MEMQLGRLHGNNSGFGRWGKPHITKDLARSPTQPFDGPSGHDYENIAGAGGNRGQEHQNQDNVSKAVFQFGFHGGSSRS
jgi:hypothetical protein